MRKKRSNENGDGNCELDVDIGRLVECKCLKRGILEVYIYGRRNS